MGLLDEAIRDHLELKRRRGADLTEVAREEAEALAPVFPDQPLLDASPGDPEDGLQYVEPGRSLDGENGLDPGPEPGHVLALPPELATPGQETAELDMQAVLDQDARSFDGDRSVPDEIPGQERLSFE